MCEVYSAKCIQYVYNNWIVYKEKFVHAWTDMHLHFRIRVTSRGEGNHWVLKRYLKISSINLLTVLLKLNNLLKTQYVELNKAMEVERLQTWHHHNVDLLKNLIGKVSKYALDKILE